MGVMFFFGVLDLGYFSAKGEVLETTDPNIYFIYTVLSTDQFGQHGTREIINRQYQTDGTIYMLTLGNYPSPGDNVSYFRLEFLIRWPVHKILWLNFVY